LHKQDVFLKLYNNSIEMPLCEMCANEVLSLPMFPELTGDEIRRIAEVINHTF
jgi:dTDP-4-amino-4,6-dideoxygalactose transaminase